MNTTQNPDLALIPVIGIPLAIDIVIITKALAGSILARIALGGIVASGLFVAGICTSAYLGTTQKEELHHDTPR